MSQIIENILYAGHNIQLAQSMLDLFTPASSPSDYCLSQINNADQVEAALENNKYSHFICQIILNESLMDKIAVNFPSLKVTYLTPPKKKLFAEVMEGDISEEVKKALDYLSIPIYFKNTDGLFLACNSYFAHLVGMSTTNIIGKKVVDILPGDLDKEKTTQKEGEKNKVYFNEFTLFDPTGRARDVVLRKECIKNSETQIGILFDVTEINETRRALEKERVMLRATANISKDLIFFKDLKGQFLGCNKQFEQFVGCPEKDIIGKTDDQLFEFYQALMCQEQDQDVMMNNQTYIGEEYLTYNNGERHFIDMKKEPLQNKYGQVQGLIGVGRDITASHRMQKRLKITESVFENSIENIFVSDDQGNIIEANKTCCETIGYSKSELLQSNVSIFECNRIEDIELTLQSHDSWQGELSYKAKNGETHYAWVDIYLLEHEEKGNFSRISTWTESKKADVVEKKIQHLAKYDPLTSLFNRIAFFTRLEEAMTRAEHKEGAMAVIITNINNFAELNDQYGHNVGDAVLIEIARRFKSCVFEKDTVARFGTHEFIIIVDELANEEDAAIVARKISAQFDPKFVIEQTELSITAALGIAIFPDDGMDIDTLVDSAEEAMQRGKFDKGTSYHFYTNELTCHSKQQFKLEKELQEALELDQFDIFYRPQFNIKKRQTVAIEALLRWNHPVRGLLHPDNFLVIAENSGLLDSISEFVLEKVAKQAANWHKADIHFGRIAVSIPLSELENIHFISSLQNILLKNKCQSQWLEFSIDESYFLSVSQIVHDNLLSISKLGIAIIVDNYGADRPALYLAEKLSIEKIRLAKHYTEGGISAYFTGSAVINALTLLGQSLGVDIVSDTIEELNEEPSDNFIASVSDEKVMKSSEATFYLRCNKRK